MFLNPIVSILKNKAEKHVCKKTKMQNYFNYLFVKYLTVIFMLYLSILRVKL